MEAFSGLFKRLKFSFIILPAALITFSSFIGLVSTGPGAAESALSSEANFDPDNLSLDPESRQALELPGQGAPEAAAVNAASEAGGNSQTSASERKGMRGSSPVDQAAGDESSSSGSGGSSGAGSSPTPSPSTTPEPTQTPAPTSTSSPTKTEEPSATARPTKTPAPRVTPTPTQSDDDDDDDDDDDGPNTFLTMPRLHMAGRAPVSLQS